MVCDRKRYRLGEIPEDGPLRQDDLPEPREPVPDPNEDEESVEDEEIEIPDKGLDPDEDVPDDLPDGR